MSPVTKIFNKQSATRPDGSRRSGPGQDTGGGTLSVGEVIHPEGSTGPRIRAKLRHCVVEYLPKSAVGDRNVTVARTKTFVRSYWCLPTAHIFSSSRSLDRLGWAI